jgi:hypothetical protein
MNVPSNFDFYSEFTLAAWIFGGISPNDAIAFGIECREMRVPILQVGKWPHIKELQLIHHAPGANSYWVSSYVLHEIDKWYYVAVVYKPSLTMFYLDGELQSTSEIRMTRTPLSGVRDPHLSGAYADEFHSYVCALAAQLGMTKSAVNGMER